MFALLSRIRTWQALRRWPSFLKLSRAHVGARFFRGERLTVIRIAGMASAFAGALLVARGETSGANPTASAKKGIVWAALAAVLFGIMFWLLGTHVIPATGAYATVWLMRGVAAFVTLGILGAKRSPLGLPDAKTTAQAAGTALLDTGAFVLVI